ncbi:unnamed protein product [Symbiodinium microadriaticum]|nr:unnamed protein product [Symbiodinium microadriaticum]
MTEQEELHSLQEYFRDLYASSETAPPVWSLQQALHITVMEVVDAFSHLSAKKALPPGQVPAALWKVGAEFLAPHVCDTLNAVLKPGPLIFPASWHRAFITLIPKAGKPPSKPPNLRPISLLPAIPKLLARIAAERLKPYLEQAMHLTPQFAYLRGRQVADAIDRVLAHCNCVRAESQAHDRSVFRLRSGIRGAALFGGLQLSLDLSKAYDRMPRALLLKSLQHVNAPPDIIALIMYIHDNATLVITRHGSQATSGMGQGVRQGCGLSPLLWLGFTLLLFETFNSYLPEHALTGYADDFHVKWTLNSPLDFRNACSQISRMLTDLESFGMQPAIDKTVILLRLKGKHASQLLREFVVKRGQQRFLSLQRLNQRVLLPIKQSHLYLGIKIGYGRFERETVQYRMSQSWVAFYRLHGLLKHTQIPLRKRLLLWQTCVWAITKHGLTSMGLDRISAERLVSQVHRRSIASMRWLVFRSANIASANFMDGQSSLAILRHERYTLWGVRAKANSTTSSLMADNQLLEAEAELHQFGAYMKREQQSSIPSTGPPSVADRAAPTQEEMDVDRDKRSQEEGRDLPASKWAKGEAKGQSQAEKKADEKAEPSGKGHSEIGSGSRGSEEPAPTPPTSAIAKRAAAKPATRYTGFGRTAQQGRQGNGGGQRSQQWWSKKDGNRWDKEDDPEKLKDIIRGLTRLVVRLEDAMTISNLDCEFVLFLQTEATGNQWSITTGLYNTAQEWKSKKEKNPQEVNQPLRNVMFFCMWTVLLEMLEKMADPTNRDVYERAREMNIIEDQSYVYLRWSAEEQRHVKDTQEPVPHEQVYQAVKTIQNLCMFPDILGRFHALRPLSASHAGEVVPFLCVIQNRTTESQQMYSLLRRLCRCGCTHLIGMTIRPSKIGRSPLAVQIEKQVQSL